MRHDAEERRPERQEERQSPLGLRRASQNDWFAARFASKGGEVRTEFPALVFVHRSSARPVKQTDPDRSCRLGAGVAHVPHPPMTTSKGVAPERAEERSRRCRDQPSAPRRRGASKTVQWCTRMCAVDSAQRAPANCIHSETQRHALWHSGCTLRTRCRQSSEGTARVERTGRAAGGEWHRVVEGLEG